VRGYLLLIQYNMWRHAGGLILVFVELWGGQRTQGPSNGHLRLKLWRATEIKAASEIENAVKTGVTSVMYT
jgi:hypothetical protein